MADPTIDEGEYYTNILTQPSNAYDGASTNYKQDIRGLLNGSPDSLLAREIAYLRMRAAHLVRNNGYAKTAFEKNSINLQAIKVNWVNSKGKAHKLMQGYWDEFEADPNLDGYGTLKNTQDLWTKSMWLAGDSYTRFQIRKNAGAVPLKLQVIPSEMHNIFYNGDGVKDKDVKYGIRFKDTKPVSYFFQEDFYNSIWQDVAAQFKLKEIPATELIHMFIRSTPGQWLNPPALTSVLLPLFELDELVDATVAKQKAAQAISWIIENTNPASMTPSGIPVAVTDTLSGKEKIVFRTSGTNVQYMNKGEKIHFHQSTDIGANLPNLIKSELQRIAASQGIPYHSLSGDTDSLDFSTIRAIAIELRRRVEYIHHFYTIPLGLGRVAAYFKKLALLRGLRVSEAKPSYQLPRWYGVDDLKDTQADVLEVQMGLATLKSKLDERHTTYEEIKEDRGVITDLGLHGLLTPDVKNMGQTKNTEANTNSTGN